MEATLKNKNNELSEAVNTINNHEYSLEAMKIKMTGLQTKANEANELGEKIFQYESKFNQLNTKVQTLQREVDLGEQIKNENEGMRRKLYQFNEMTQRVNEYEQKIQMMSR